jgi:hypothetical protein
MPRTVGCSIGQGVRMPAKKLRTPEEWIWYRGRQWYIAEAKAGLKVEFKAEKKLREQGYETIFPTKPDYWFLSVQQRRARKNRRRKPRDHEGSVAILGKYIFVGAAPGQSVRAIRETVGIQDVMDTASREVYRVPAPAIEAIERWLGGDELRKQPDEAKVPRKGEVYRIGDHVQNFAGMLAEIAHDADEKHIGEKIKVLIRFMGGRVEASIPAEYLGERAEVPRKAAERGKARSKQRAEHA